MELTKLKDDLYVPTDFAKHHAYFADPEGKKPYTGITSILGVLAKPALIQWAANEAVKYLKEHARNVGALESGKLDDLWYVSDEDFDEARTAHAHKKDKAAEHGTDTHALVEKYINLCLPPFTRRGEPQAVVPDAMAAIEPFITWALNNVDHFLFSERRMSDTGLFIAGTADFGCVMKDGKKLMGDFKTSSGIYGIDYWLQVAAYRLLAEGEGDEAYDGSVIVRLGKDGSFEVKYLYEYETFRDAFLACLTIYRAQNAIKGLVIN